MQGGVYQIPIQGRHDNLPHPHVVVLEISGAKECLLVPAFGADGHEVNEYVEIIQRRGFDRSEVCVEMDNAQVITFESGFPGKQAIWVVERHRRLTVKEMHRFHKVGQMSSDGLVQIAQCLLRFADRSGTLSPSLQKKLRNLIRDHAA